VGTIEFTYIALLVVLALWGAGAVSVDHLLARRFAAGAASELRGTALRSSSV
jgi:hypothetical protein